MTAVSVISPSGTSDKTVELPEEIFREVADATDPGVPGPLVERIAAEPAAVLRGRMSLSGREKATVAVKALTGRFG